MNDILSELEDLTIKLEVINDTLKVLREEYFDCLGKENLERNILIISAVIKNIENDLGSELEKAKSIVDEEYEKVEQKNNPK